MVTAPCGKWGDRLLQLPVGRWTLMVAAPCWGGWDMKVTAPYWGVGHEGDRSLRGGEQGWRHLPAGVRTGMVPPPCGEGTGRGRRWQPCPGPGVGWGLPRAHRASLPTPGWSLRHSRDLHPHTHPGSCRVSRPVPPPQPPTLHPRGARRRGKASPPPQPHPRPVPPHPVPSGDRNRARPVLSGTGPIRGEGGPP